MVSRSVDNSDDDNSDDGDDDDGFNFSGINYVKLKLRHDAIASYLWRQISTRNINKIVHWCAQLGFKP